MLNLLITAIGRDLLTLIGLVIGHGAPGPGDVAVRPRRRAAGLIVLRKLMRRIYRIARNQFTGGAHILETMQETLQGIRTVKAFTLEDTMRERHRRQHRRARTRSPTRWRASSHRASPLMEALGGFAIAGALIYGGYRMIETGATPGQFFSFLAAFLLAYEPAKRLARLNIDLNAALVGVRMLFEIIDSPPTEPPDDGKPQLKLERARVELSDVHFAYRPGEPVLRGMSLRRRTRQGHGPGRPLRRRQVDRAQPHAALLRSRSAASILIDGQDIAGVSRGSLRRQIAYVGQDVFLFHGTIRDNIAVRQTGARPTSEIVAAAQAACAHDFIMAFPHGYETPVGERGAQLSGGQRQRIAIARALIKDAPIILLDEATASLDSESERQVQDAIEHLCEGRTTLVIAHRLHTIMHADRIQVIEGGTIVESGRHDDLLRRGRPLRLVLPPAAREEAPDARPAEAADLPA